MASTPLASVLGSDQDPGPLSGILVHSLQGQLRQFPLHGPQAWQIQHLWNSVFYHQSFSTAKLTSVVKSRNLGLILSNSPFLFTISPCSANHQVPLNLISPLTISQFNPFSPFPLLLPEFKSPSPFSLILLNKLSSYQSSLPHVCPLFSLKDRSKAQIWL